MTARNIYAAIMCAAAEGRGLRLTADEVVKLASDDAIETHANECLTLAQCEAVYLGGWGALDPRKVSKEPRP